MSDDITADESANTSQDEASKVDVQSTGDKATEPIQLPDDHPLVKAYRAERERNKSLSAKAQKLDEIEAASLSELEKAQKDLAELQRERDEAQIAAARATVAASKGVPAELLSGTTEAELTASADALLEFRGRQSQAPGAVGQGSTGKAPSGPTQLTTADLSTMTPEQINQARRDGRLNSILGNT